MFFVHILLQEFQIGFYFEVESSQEMQCVHSVQAVVHQKHIDRANSCLFLHFLTADHFENSFIQSLGVKEQEGAARCYQPGCFSAGSDQAVALLKPNQIC